MAASIRMVGSPLRLMIFRDGLVPNRLSWGPEGNAEPAVVHVVFRPSDITKIAKERLRGSPVKRYRID